MKKLNNYSELGYSDGEKSCFQTIHYKSVSIHSCLVDNEIEVTCTFQICGQKYGYKGKSVEYAKRKIRELRKKFTASQWYTELKR